MKILAADDEVRLNGEWGYEPVKSVLLQAGHDVVSFTGRDEDGRPFPGRTQLHEALTEVIRVEEPDGIVLDLGWRDDLDAGTWILGKLIEVGLVDPKEQRIVVYSKFNIEQRNALLNLGVEDRFILNRLKDSLNSLRECFA